MVKVYICSFRHVVISNSFTYNSRFIARDYFAESTKANPAGHMNPHRVQCPIICQVPAYHSHSLLFRSTFDVVIHSAAASAWQLLHQRCFFVPISASLSDSSFCTSSRNLVHKPRDFHRVFDSKIQSTDREYISSNCERLPVHLPGISYHVPPRWTRNISQERSCWKLLSMA
jgi:hypothetical protein